VEEKSSIMSIKEQLQQINLEEVKSKQLQEVVKKALDQLQQMEAAGVVVDKTIANGERTYHLVKEAFPEAVRAKKPAESREEETAIAEKVKPAGVKRLAAFKMKKAQAVRKNQTKTAEEKQELKEQMAAKPIKKLMVQWNEEEMADCEATISKVHEILRKHKAAIAPKMTVKARKRRASEIISTGMVSVLSRVVKAELSKDKVTRVKPEKLKEARDQFSLALKSLRAALGGIAIDNDSFIQSFKSQMDELIKQVETKQKQAEEAKTA
jgi:hypothetical protein